MCVCVSVCVGGGMYVGVCIYVCGCVCVILRVCMSVRVYVCVSVCLYVCMSVYVYVSRCLLESSMISKYANP